MQGSGLLDKTVRTSTVYGKQAPDNSGLPATPATPTVYPLSILKRSITECSGNVQEIYNHHIGPDCRDFVNTINATGKKVLLHGSFGRALLMGAAGVLEDAPDIDLIAKFETREARFKWLTDNLETLKTKDYLDLSPILDENDKIKDCVENWPFILLKSNKNRLQGKKPFEMSLVVGDNAISEDDFTCWNNSIEMKKDLEWGECKFSGLNDYKDNILRFNNKKVLNSNSVLRVVGQYCNGMRFPKDTDIELKHFIKILVDAFDKKTHSGIFLPKGPAGKFNLDKYLQKLGFSLIIKKNSAEENHDNFVALQALFRSISDELSQTEEPHKTEITTALRDIIDALRAIGITKGFLKVPAAAPVNPKPVASAAYLAPPEESGRGVQATAGQDISKAEDDVEFRESLTKIIKKIINMVTAASTLVTHRGYEKTKKKLYTQENLTKAHPHEQKLQPGGTTIDLLSTILILSDILRHTENLSPMEQGVIRAVLHLIKETDSSRPEGNYVLNTSEASIQMLKIQMLKNRLPDRLPDFDSGQTQVSQSSSGDPAPEEKEAPAVTKNNRKLKNKPLPWLDAEAKLAEAARAARAAPPAPEEEARAAPPAPEEEARAARIEAEAKLAEATRAEKEAEAEAKVAEEEAAAARATSAEEAAEAEAEAKVAEEEAARAEEAAARAERTEAAARAERTEAAARAERTEAAAAEEAAARAERTEAAAARAAAARATRAAAASVARATRAAEAAEAATRAARATRAAEAARATRAEAARAAKVAAVPAVAKNNRKLQNKPLPRLEAAARAEEEEARAAAEAKVAEAWAATRAEAAAARAEEEAKVAEAWAAARAEARAEAAEAATRAAAAEAARAAAAAARATRAAARATRAAKVAAAVAKNNRKLQNKPLPRLAAAAREEEARA